MSIHQHSTINNTVYFWFGSNDTGGSGADGATPVYDVRLAGAAAGAAPVLSGAATLLTHANYPAGCHEIAIAATVANGFAANATYAVFCTLLVDAENPTGFAGSFTLRALSGVTLTGVASAGTSTTITLTGGVAVTGFYDGQLVVIESGTGAGQSRTILSYANTTIATVTRDWTTAPDATSVFSVHAADVVTLLEAGTATAGANSTITLDATASTTVNIYKSNFIAITGGAGVGQTRLITAYSAGRVATVIPNWVTNPAAGSVYQIIPSGQVNIGEWLGETVSLSANNQPDVNVDEWNDTLVATGVPDAAGTAAALHVTTDAAIAALNDFNPAIDTVARVTLCDTTTTNTDMRGTDGANTTVPDAAGTAPTATEIWELAGQIDGKTPTEALQIIAATTAGEVSGVGVGPEVFLGLDGLTTRVTVTLDGSNNRTGVVYG
jgi:hypothetical protein